VAQAEPPAGDGEHAGQVCGAVVGHHRPHTDIEAAIERHGAFEIAHGRELAFVRENLHIGQAGTVVDADMHVLPPGSLDPLAAVPMDAVPDPTRDAPELLHIDMQEIARAASFDADRLAAAPERPWSMASSDHARSADPSDDNDAAA
jgi:hypothetical protein